MSAAAPRRECAGAIARLRTPQPGASRTLPLPLLASVLPQSSMGKRSAGQARPTFCLLRSFVFQTFRVSKLRGRKGLSSLQEYLSPSKPSRPGFHILQLTVWDLHRFIPHSRAQSLHAVQPERMRAHPLPFSAGCCREPSPLSLAVAAAGVPAPETAPGPRSSGSSPLLPTAVLPGLVIRTLL